MTASQWCLKIFCTQSFDEELATIINHDFRTATSLHPPARLGSAKLLPPNLAARPIGRREQLFARSARSGQRHHQPRRQDLLGARGPNSGHFESPETEAVIEQIFSQFDDEKRLGRLTKLHELEGRLAEADRLR